MSSPPRTVRHRRDARKSREGAALLIVLLVLMMATSTAAYAVHSTQFEQRAAGSLHQAIRTKFVAEAATIGVLEFCYQLTTTGCTDLKRANDNLTSTLRDKFALPSYPDPSLGPGEIVYQLGPSDLTGNAFPNTIIPADSALAAGGTASSFRPDFMTVMEKWQVPTPGETREHYRLIVSTYGDLSYDTTATSTARGNFESISATRAFFDVR